MSAEIEELMGRLRQNRNVTDNRGRIIQKQTRFLTSKERTIRKDELKFINGTVNQPAWVNKGMTGETMKTLTNRRNHLEDDLRDNAPPEVSSDARDALYKYQHQLEEEISHGMPTGEVMRRNPVGATDMHTGWENTNKTKIRTWKNVCRLIEPDNDQKDYTNVERLRKTGITQDMAATYMMNGQIPGNFAQTALSKANWPEGMPEYGTVDTALKQVERTEMAEEMVAKGFVPQSQYEELKAELKKLQQEVSLNNISPDAVVTASPEAVTVTDAKADVSTVSPENITLTEQVRKKSKGSPWKCDLPECGEEMLTTQKGAHIGKHRREVKKQAKLQS